MNLVDTAYINNSIINDQTFSAPVEEVEDAGVRVLKTHIKLGSMMVHTEQVAITPAVATYLLSLNANNRSKSAQYVANIANDMKAGKFVGLNGQTIVISKDGYLNDGQTRLTAIVNSGVTIPMMVVFGVDRESRFTIDQGRARNINAFAKMAGVTNFTDAPAAAKLALLYKEKAFKKDGHTPPRRDWNDVDRILAMVTENEEAFNTFVNHVQKSSIGPRTALVAAMVLIREATKDDFSFADFFEKLLHGNDLSLNDPVLTVRNRLVQDRYSQGIQSSDKIEWIVRGWNFYRAGKPMQRVVSTRSYPDPVA